MAGEIVERRDVEGRLIERVVRPTVADRLDLEPHPEGGWYRRTWTSPEHVVTADGRRRPTATGILFALPAGETSAWHRVSSAELWFWHGPDTLRLQTGGDGDEPGDGPVSVLEAGAPQLLVPAGVWQRTLPGLGEVVVSCVVSPGFDFADFTMAAAD
jgi:predicted cupin superfamily sugar epimerase